MKKATLEELINRRQQDALVTKEVQIESIGLSFTVRKLPLGRVLRMLDGAEINGTVSEKFELYKELIYESVPLFQDKRLQDAYGCVEPYDIVPKVLNDNIQAIGELGDAICGFYGLGGQQVIDELKN